MTARISRRGVLGLAVGAVTVAGAGGPLLTGWRTPTSTGTLLPSRAPLPPPFQRPLAVPPVLVPVRTDGTTDYYEVTQRVSAAELLPGLRTPIWGYNGIFPGPTIASRSGRRTVVKHRNQLPVPAVVHLHGGHTPPEHDGYPIDLILPVGSIGLGGHNPHLAEGRIAHGEREYVYPLQQRATTLWYHDHRMDFTGPSVWRGLAGFHLVHDDEEERLGLPAAERDIPLLICDRSFAADGAFQYPSLDPELVHRAGVTEKYVAGVLGDVILVNGVPWPLAEVPAVRHRLRILNASNARRYRLALDPPPPGGGGLVQIGTDGGLLPHPIAHDAIEIAPAQRFDVVVDFSRYRPGQAVTLVNEFGSGGTGNVMRFRVGARAADPSRVPDTLSDVPPLDPAKADVRRTFTFRTGKVGGMTGWRTNGKPFDPNRADANPRLGDVEVWRLQSDFHHPIHLHLVQFQVIGRDNKPAGEYDAGWKDTVDLRPNEQVDVIARFTGYAGRYPMHCHNLEHEDMAMMANFVTS
ncbi:MAG: copper oxidase [Actinobacteria bacterium 13_1_20CM_3_71_11]|nr:MAG: copper oxidase [Actinobacteria bacterium 13_1_20CM_3_71_11]